ncbi:MAG: hypothetical protein J6E48_06625 [Prevotella sp.]|nr:hypothetical protein [Prevotella sp.]
MKKIKQMAYVGAIALVSVVGFTACSSSDETALDPTPSYEGESVKTQFTISLPENIKMRMASATVQETGFRGIDNIKLVPYSLTSGDVIGTSMANANLISLAAISASEIIGTNSKSKVYADVNLMKNTSNFLFYGKAIDNSAGTAITTVTDKFQFGTLSITGLSGKPTLSSVEFTPVSIYADATDEGKAIGTSLIAALNAVANATPTEALSDTKKPAFKAVTEDESAIIYSLWNNFKELTTGSSKNIEWVLKELYMNLDGLVTTAAQTTVPDGYKMAVAIRTVIETYCDIEATSGVTTAVSLKSTYTGYPANVNLPDGAVFVSYDTESKEFKAASNMSSMNVSSLSSYVYPANLQYYVNSPVKVSNSVQSPSYGEKTWTEILGLYNTGVVTDETRSVAIVNPVEYGVARLDAKVNGLEAEGSTNGDTYYDHDGTVVNVTNGFELTGILIGGQRSVGWDFVKKGTDVYTIFDRTMNGSSTAMTVKRKDETATNYTLVLQSTDNETVNVALEFINNCSDFVGANGEIIPHGATFYLIGALKPSAANTQANNYASLSDEVKSRVFTQDFKTIATFSIKLGTNNNPNDESTQEGLGTATKGLPDLRTPIMELGLSVDLEWQPGLNFNVDI